jgi:hypothetical protein
VGRLEDTPAHVRGRDEGQGALVGLNVAPDTHIQSEQQDANTKDKKKREKKKGHTISKNTHAQPRVVQKTCHNDAALHAEGFGL